MEACVDKLANFVVRERGLDVLGCEWGSVDWVLGIPTAATQNSVPSIHFGIGDARRGPVTPFHAEYDEFAKALVLRFARNRQEQPTHSVYGTLMRALRALHEALAARSAGPTQIIPADLTRAAGLISGRHDKLAWIAKVIDAERLTEKRLRWKPDKRAPQGEPDRDDLLMTSEQLLAVVELWNMRHELAEFDQLRLCVLMLLIIGGFRFEEGATLPARCLLKEKVYDAERRPVLDSDGRHVVRYGLIFHPAKGEADVTMRKPVPTVMGPVLEQVVELALSLTAEARHVARVQSERRTTTLGPEWDDLPDDHALSVDEVARALGLPTGSTEALRARMRYQGIPSWTEARDHGRTLVKKGDLYAHLYELSFHKNCRPREGFNLQLRDLLFVVRRGQGAVMAGWRGTAKPLSYMSMIRFLQGSRGERSVFQRHGITVAPISTHMPRYFLNTLAMHAGLGEQHIAHWMGRRTTSANKNYDLRPRESVTEEIRARIDPVEPAGPTRPWPIRPLSPDEVLVGQGEAWHVTPVGACSHDYGSTPCPRYMEMVRSGFDRGVAGPIDLGTMVGIASRIEDQLADARAEDASGTHGAKTWVAAHEAALLSIRNSTPRGATTFGSAGP